MEGKGCFGGNRRMLEEAGLYDDNVKMLEEKLAAEGKTPLFFACDGILLGIIAWQTGKTDKPCGHRRNEAHGAGGSNAYRRQRAHGAGHTERGRR